MELIDILAPLGLVAMLAIIALIVVSARRQRANRQHLFADFADIGGYSYLDTDDGTAEAISQGFKDFTRFTSASLGPQPPTNVVYGNLKEGRLCLFTHGTRDVEGQARHWYVCIVERSGIPCSDKLVRCFPRHVRRVRTIGGPSVVSFDNDPLFESLFEVRAMDSNAARHCLAARAREFIASEQNQMPFLSEIQILDRRVAVYPASRNEDIDSKEKLIALVEFAYGVAAALNR